MNTPDTPVRSGTTAEWAASDAPVLAAGEIGVNTTTGDMRIGDGSTAFASLPLVGGVKKGRATLVAGTVTVTATWVTATSIILTTHQTLGTVTAPKAVGVTARSAGVSFTITSADATDTSVIGWMSVEP